MHNQAAYQRSVPVPLQKTRAVQARRTFCQKFRRAVHAYGTAILGRHNTIGGQVNAKR